MKKPTNLNAECPDAGSENVERGTEKNNRVFAEGVDLTVSWRMPESLASRRGMEDKGDKDEYGEEGIRRG